MDSVIISTPANINRRDRPIDQLMKEDIDVDIETVVETHITRPIETVEQEPSPPLEIPTRHKKETTKAVTFQSHRQGHESGDSMSLLRKLARATSTSPSPKAEAKKRDMATEDRENAQPPHDGIPKAKSLRNPRRVISEPPHPKSALEAIVNEAKENHDPQYGDNTIASLEDIISPNLEATNSTLNNTPDASKKEEKPYRRPSRLAESVRTEGASEKQGRSHDTDESLTQAQKERQQEEVAWEALNKRLNTAHSTLSDANRGLRRIENRIEGVEAVDSAGLKAVTSDDKGTAGSKAPASKTITGQRPQSKPEGQPEVPKAHVSAPTTITTTSTVMKQPEVHVCARCGGPSLWQGLWAEMCSNFYWYNADKGYRLTWLGWVLFLWLAWLTAELSLHDMYADYIHGPIFPFITFNVTVRSVLSLFGRGW
ncbi:Hypothetical predicted protein [Lecanosticta acicola]|uniref:Uncharacterized protein n=1 Tax=Lecanosticta acicola TaxID=111012 RepID=A0AAI9E7N2_9PEZI|nr:Hypothetical predicted protein [Lecanosticta acicola]